MGINSCNIYRTRIATLNSDYRHLGPSMVTAVNSRDRLVEIMERCADFMGSVAGTERVSETFKVALGDARTILTEIKNQ